MHVERRGAGDPLLCLHAEDAAGRWDRWHELLAERFDVIAPEGPGFGRSEELDWIEGMDDLVYAYLDLLDELGLERAAVLGVSFGGWLAAELAVHSPQRVRGLVLVGAMGLELPEHPIADVFLERPPAADVEERIAAYRDATAFARIAWNPLAANPKLERRLARVTAPTLVLWGEDDEVVPLEHGRRYAERIADARLVLLPGRTPLAEQPERAVAEISEFLA